MDYISLINWLGLGAGLGTFLPIPIIGRKLNSLELFLSTVLIFVLVVNLIK